MSRWLPWRRRSQTLHAVKEGKEYPTPEITEHDSRLTDTASGPTVPTVTLTEPPESESDSRLPSSGSTLDVPKPKRPPLKHQPSAISDGAYNSSTHLENESSAERPRVLSSASDASSATSYHSARNSVAIEPSPTSSGGFPAKSSVPFSQSVKEELLQAMKEILDTKMAELLDKKMAKLEKRFEKIEGQLREIQAQPESLSRESKEEPISSDGLPPLKEVN